MVFHEIEIFYRKDTHKCLNASLRPLPNVACLYLELFVGSERLAEDLVEVHDPFLAPQEGHGGVRGVDGVQGLRRRRFYVNTKHDTTLSQTNRKPLGVRSSSVRNGCITPLSSKQLPQKGEKRKQKQSRQK